VKRKILSLFLCVFIVTAITGVLSGCNGSRPNKNTGEKMTIRVVDNDVFLTSSDELTDPDSDYYDERWAYICDKFNVRFEYVSVNYSTWADQIRIMINTDSLPDVAVAALPSPAEYQKYASQGIIKPLPTDYATKYPNIAKNVEAVTAKEAFMYDGQYIAIPRSLDMGGKSTDYTFQFIYNKKWAIDAGVQIKDAYTVEELYDMYTKVQAKNPNALMYNSIQPNMIFQLGIYQYIDTFFDKPKDNFVLNKDKNTYEWVAAKPEFIEGLKWTKKFYDSGFIHKEYTTLPMYEARTEFATGKTFSYYDGSDINFFCNTVRDAFVQQNPGQEFTDNVDAALLLSSDGKYMERDLGNYWSEVFFSNKIKDDVFERFLEVYDFLCSEEGQFMHVFGMPEKDYTRDAEGNTKTLREINPESGLYNQFNLKVPDGYMMVYHGPVEGTSIHEKNPSLETKARDRIAHLFNLKAKGPTIKFPYDSKLKAYDSRDFNAFTGDPYKQMNMIITTTKNENEAAAKWTEFVNANKAGAEAVIKELNEKLLG